MVYKKDMHLDFVTFLEMKDMIDNQPPDYSWRIVHPNGCAFEIALDDGSQSYYTVRFSKEDYEEHEVVRIGIALAKMLDVEDRL